jgi:hypothetical protein
LALQIERTDRTGQIALLDVRAGGVQVLLFRSDRGGPWGLWALDVKDGRPAGTPRLVKSAISEDPGRFAPLGLTSDGALLYVTSRATRSGIRIAQLDFAAARLMSPPRDAGIELASINAVRSFAWSANGQSLAVSRRVRPGMDAATLLSVKDMTTGAIRETRPRSGSCVGFLQWASSGGFFVCLGPHVDERQNARPLRYGIVRMAADTGEVTFVAPGRAPALSSNGQTVYLLRDIEGRPEEQHVAIVERQLASGVERELHRRPSLAGLSLSPDGRWLATVSRNRDAGTSALLFVSISGDITREVVALPRGETFDAQTLFWSPDSGSVFARKSGAGIKPSFVRAALDGKVTTHPDLDLGVDIRVHPDGRQIAYAVPGVSPGVTRGAPARPDNGSALRRSRVRTARSGPMTAPLQLLRTGNPRGLAEIAFLDVPYRRS